MKYDIHFQLEIKRNMEKGKYYAVEGIDGSGKTTQAKLLADYLKRQGKEVLLTKEPTNGPIAQLIYKVLHKEITMPSISLQYLFCADRAVHLEEVVIPALKEGKIVVSDRSLWSAVAYGIADQDLDKDEKERILVAYNAVLALYDGFLVPDKTIILKIPFAISVDRTEKRHEQKQSIYDMSEELKQIEKEYMWLSEKFADVITVIDGDHDHTPEQIHEKLVHSLHV